MPSIGDSRRSHAWLTNHIKQIAPANRVLFLRSCVRLSCPVVCSTFLKKMNTVKYLVIFLICSLIVQGRRFQRCRSSDDCDADECCARKRCKPLLREGKRCNPKRMINSHQCQCAKGYSCMAMFRNRVTTSKSKCQSIIVYDYKELMEVVINI